MKTLALTAFAFFYLFIFSIAQTSEKIICNRGAGTAIKVFHKYGITYYLTVGHLAYGGGCRVNDKRVNFLASLDGQKKGCDGDKGLYYDPYYEATILAAEEKADNFSVPIWLPNTEQAISFEYFLWWKANNELLSKQKKQDGIVKVVWPHPDWVFQINTPGVFGMSGSGVFDSKQRLVGMFRSGFDYGPSYVVSINVLYYFMSEVIPEYNSKPFFPSWYLQRREVYFKERNANKMKCPKTK